MKRISKTSPRQIPKRSPKLPDELIPIVDAVVDVVFERLRGAASAEAVTKGRPARSKTARLNLPLPKQRTALAEALADLLLSDLANKARADKRKPKPKRRPAKPAPRRVTLPKKRRVNG